MENKLCVFGQNYLKDFKDNLRLIGPDFIFYVNDLKSRLEVLKRYRDINAGGTQHTKEEIDKVDKLIESEKDS